MVYGSGGVERLLDVLTNDYFWHCEQCKPGKPMATEAQNAVVPECEDQNCTDYVQPPHAPYAHCHP